MLVTAALLLCTRGLAAQNILSVPFTQGFIGTRGSSAGTANNVLTYQTLEIARTFFIQSSSTTQYEIQGNDIPGTLRIVRTNGTTIDMPASVNWRNNGGQTYLIGILPRPASPVTLTYSGGSITITDGSVNGGSSIGGYMAGYAGATLTDGQNTSGNAAQSGALSALNTYLATVVQSRPAGPVTVTTQSTASTTPTITGTATLGVNEALTVVVGGTQYSSSTTPAVQRSGSAWSLALTGALATGTYDVSATITNADGFTLTDATTNELTITPATTTLTVGGSFVANGKVYDGTTSGSGNAAGLTLVGVTPGHDVQVGTVTYAFTTPAAGVSRTMQITNLVLTGAQASLYTVSLAGAPTATATILQRAATITGVSAVSREYDGTTVASLTGTPAYGNLASGESFAVTGTPVATFATKTVGTGKAVTVTGYTAPSANYTVTQPTGLTASITAKALTIGGSFTAANKPYDGTTTATIATNALTLTGAAVADTVTLANVVAAFASPTTGAGKVVSVTSASLDGASAGNYTLSLSGAPTTTAEITAVSHTVTIGGTFTANDKVYDAVTNATGNIAGLSLTGVQPGDVVSIAAATLAFQSPAVGTGRTVSITGVTLTGANAGTYTVSLAGAPTATAAITRAPLTLGGAFVAASKVFDGTTAATVTSHTLTLQGGQASDALAITGVTAQFATATVGTAKPVTLTGVTLSGATSNYTLSLAGAPTTTANITSAEPPGVPRSVIATAGDASVSTSWDAPLTIGCSAIRSYTVETSRDDGATWTAVSITAPTRAATLAALTNNLPHLQRVRAVNDCGSSDPSTAVAFVPVAVTRENGTTPRTNPAGAGTITTGGTATPAPLEVVGDSALVVGRGGPVVLSLQVVDSSSAAIPVDSTRVVSFEQGSRALVNGQGFKPGTVATLYLYSNATPSQPVLLAQVPVLTGGRFDASSLVAGTLAPGAYTVQVNGIDATGQFQSVAIGVEVTEPPPELDLTSTPDKTNPAPGDTVTITLRVVNRGTGPATDVEIPRAFSEPGFRILTVSPVHGSYDATTHTWTIPRIEVGSTAVLRITALVIAPAGPPASPTVPGARP